MVIHLIFIQTYTEPHFLNIKTYTTTASTSDTAVQITNERTLLSWIRTSIGIMAFGCVVVKFSLFVKQISLILDKLTPAPTGSYSVMIGIVLVAVSTFVLLLLYMCYQ